MDFIALLGLDFEALQSPLRTHLVIQGLQESDRISLRLLVKDKVEALHNQIIVSLLISVANAHLLPYIALAVSAAVMVAKKESGR